MVKNENFLDLIWHLLSVLNVDIFSLLKIRFDNIYLWALGLGLGLALENSCNILINRNILDFISDLLSASDSNVYSPCSNLCQSNFWISTRVRIRDAINNFLHALFSIKCKRNGYFSSGSIWSNLMLNLEIRSIVLYGYSCEHYDHGLVFRYILIHHVEFEYFFSSFLIRTENLYCLSLLFQ